MKRIINTKFWQFSQNNSGGYFVEDNEKGVCEIMIIEAQTPKEAWNRLKEIGEEVSGFWDFCSCCGERWCDWLHEDDGTDTPMYYDTPLDQKEKGLFRERAFVHYYDGSMKEFKFR